jgi:leucyl aminopeptidase
MDVNLRKSALAARAADVLAVGVSEGGKLSGAALALDRATRGSVTALVRTGDFKGQPGETALIYPKGVKAKRVLLVGLGPRGAANGQRLLLAAAQASRRAREIGVRTLALALFEGEAFGEADAAAVGEGVVLGHYRHTAYRRDGRAPLARVEVLVASAPAKPVSAALERGVRRADAVCLARDLANTPGQDLVPESLAARAREVAKGAGAKITVLDPAAMERVGMGCVLAVGRGSAHPPRFIVLEKEPGVMPRRGAKRGAKPATIVVVGKGVTFDTGGYSLKPREGMSKMKYDMSGAAAVLGLFAASATMELPFRLVGLIPSAENMVSDRALKPGDVVRAIDGTTVEVTNTDAEGRLLLADALGYAKRFSPETVVDLATLTGAISIALGRAAAGLFTRDDTLAAEFLAAGEATGERLWRMPLWDDYLVEMKGETADLVNSSEKREGASCTAAAFLEHFAKGLRWVHLDIASTAWTYGERPESGRGANAFGVRLLTRWIETRARA